MAVEADDGVVHIAVQLKRVVGDVVALGVAHHLDDFDAAIGIFPHFNVIAIYGYYAAQLAVSMILMVPEPKPFSPLTRFLVLLMMAIMYLLDSPMILFSAISNV